MDNEFFSWDNEKRGYCPFCGSDMNEGQLIDTDCYGHPFTAPYCCEFMENSVLSGDYVPDEVY